MKKEVLAKNISTSSCNNSCGITGVILGILSIVFAMPPVTGIILGIVSFGFAIKQGKTSPNKWSKAGKILAVIGVILSIISWAVLLWLAAHPELLQQALGSTYGAYANVAQ